MLQVHGIEDQASEPLNQVIFVSFTRTIQIVEADTLLLLKRGPSKQVYWWFL